MTNSSVFINVAQALEAAGLIANADYLRMGKRGAQLSLPNGYTLSMIAGTYTSGPSQVEIAFLNGGEFVRPDGWDDDVCGYCTVEDVVKWVQDVFVAVS